MSSNTLIKKPHQITVKALIKALIYGPPGTWKTTTALSAPKVLHIDADGGVGRVAAWHQKDVIQVEKWEDITAVLSIDLSDYETIVIDTAGKMLMFMNEFVGNAHSRNRQPDGTLTQKGFGVRKQLFLEFLKKVSDLGKHIVFVAHDKEDRKGDGGVVYVRPDVGGSSGQDLVRELDLVGYIEPIGDTMTISFAPTESHYGKNTIGLPSIMKLPILNGPKNDFLAGIFETFATQVQQRQSLGASYNELMAEIKGRVDGIKTPKQANDLYKWINDHSGHIWNSLVDGKMLVVNKAKELGFVANKAAGKFEAPPKKAETATGDDKGDSGGNTKDGDKSPENEPANASAEGSAIEGQDPLKNDLGL